MDVEERLQAQVESLARKIKHYLITTMGVTLDEANAEEFYRALSLTLREEIMINWTATLHTFRTTHPRTLFYLCMEYLPGRFLGNNVTNIHATQLVKRVCERMQKNYDLELPFEPDPGLGNGGLGRLASCLLDSLATQQYPAFAYGLRYQYGIFDQEVWEGEQVERPENWLLHENPWEFRRDGHGTSVYYAGRAVPTRNQRGFEVFDLVEFEEVRALAYDVPIIGYQEGGNFNVNTLRLWTTKESPRNFLLQRYNAGLLDQASENTSLTDVLYPNDNNEVGKRIRLKQEFLLASASLQDIISYHLQIYPDMTNFADKTRIHINDTHPAFAIAELMRLLLRDHHFSWEEAWEVVSTCCHFTNHTVLKESLEEWNEHRVQYLLPRQYQIVERLNRDLCAQVQARFPRDEEKLRALSMIEGGQIKMAHLALYGSRRVNGVAALHTEILKTQVFKDFYALYPEKFVNVTNGVTQRRWLLHVNPQLSEFLTTRITSAWISDFSQVSKLAAFAADAESHRAFFQIKRAKKTALLTYLHEQNPLRDVTGHPYSHFPTLEEDALFDVQVKRLHEYKRQLMNILHVIMVYHELCANPEARIVPRMVLFAGKAAPGYEIAKKIIQLIYAVARVVNKTPKVKERLNVIFVENYNVTRAELIIPAADLSEQISTAGMEASGTGNMKLAINGALTIGTEDGANIEMHAAVTDKWWPFSFGKNAAENRKLLKERSYNPWDIYMHNPAIKRAVDALRDRSFAHTEKEHLAFCDLYHLLLEPKNSDPPDRYFVLNDLQDYYETQKKVEALYLQPSLWAEHVLHNIASMGAFSADVTICRYAKEIWEMKPCPVDKRELERVRSEYSEHDKCRIF